MAQWIGFEYREFFDVPRSIVLSLDDHLVLLESAFSDEESEYSTDYQLYLLPSDTDLSGVEARYGLSKLPPICGDHVPLPVSLQELHNNDGTGSQSRH